MPTYTPAQKTAAIQTAAQHGLKTASTQHGPKPTTIKRWCEEANITPANGQSLTKVKADREAVDNQAVAAADRSARVAAGQASLRSVGDKQESVVAAHQAVSARLVARVLKGLDALDAADVACRQAPGNKDLVAARKAAGEALDADLERARKASISYGVHVDKLLKLAGEDAGQVGGAPVSASAAVTVLLTEDPTFRRSVAASVAARYEALTVGDGSRGE